MSFDEQTFLYIDMHLFYLIWWPILSPCTCLMSFDEQLFLYMRLYYVIWWTFFLSVHLFYVFVEWINGYKPVKSPRNAWDIYDQGHNQDSWNEYRILQEG